MAISRSRINLKSVALPSEHGGWGFLIEPILLGLLVAPTWRGILITLASVGVFLIHQPLKLVVKDRLKGRLSPRAHVALRFVVVYGLLSLIPMVLLLSTTPRDFLRPVLLALPLAAVQLAYDARNRSRKFIPELCGALALAMIAPIIAMLGGWSLAAGLGLWIALAWRDATSILYVRARLKREHGKPVSSTVVWLAHGIAILVWGALCSWQIVPCLTLIAFGLLFGRAVIGLSRYRKPRAPKIIGFLELGYGFLTVIVTALGYMLE